MQAPFLKCKKLVFVPILRAGNGLLDGLLDLVPSARVGHVGLYRDPDTLAAVEYYCKVPEDLGERLTVLVDPMLATGNSAVAAVSRLKDRGARSIRLVCLLSAPEGIAAVAAAHPDVRVFAAAVDTRLHAHGYIAPGLADAGMRGDGTTERLPVLPSEPRFHAQHLHHALPQASLRGRRPRPPAHLRPGEEPARHRRRVRRLLDQP